MYTSTVYSVPCVCVCVPSAINHPFNLCGLSLVHCFSQGLGKWSIPALCAHSTRTQTDTHANCLHVVSIAFSN